MIEPLEQRTFLSASPAITSNDIAIIGRLPRSTLVAGHRIAPIVQIVRITNTADAAITGSTQIAVELSPSATGVGVTAASVTRNLNLRPGHSVSIPLVIRSLPAEPTGALFLLGVATDSMGDAATAVSANTIAVARPTIDLAPLRVIAPATARIGRTAIIRTILVNNGNTAAIGSLAIDLLASTSGVIDSNSIDLGTVSKRVAIGPGRKVILALPAALPSTGGPYFLVVNVDPGNTFSETTLANNQAVSATAVSRGPVSVVTANSITIKLTRLTTVPAADGTPQDIVTAPGVADRQYITTRDGDVLLFSNGTLTPFLDMTTAGVTVYTGGEGGLLDIAFSPTFSEAGTFGYGKFYTFDTEPFTATGPAADFSSPELFPTTNVQPNNQIVIREWTVTSPDAMSANLTSRVLMRINHPQSNHQGGALRFGPDGNLYIGLGDGGGGNDEITANDPTDGHTNATGNAQDPNVVFGKILRINPNPVAGPGFTPSENGQYSNPTSNPFAAGRGLPEIYAMGLRNPYRMSFDPATGNLYVGNVGQGAIESVDIITSGGNYGWPYFEGTRSNQLDTGRTAPAGFTFTTPIAEYTHADGQAIIGGEVDRSAEVPALDGLYIFGDLGFAGNGTIGRLLYTAADGGPISAFKFDPSGVVPSSNLYGFGVDNAGNVEAFFSDGDILVISAGK